LSSGKRILDVGFAQNPNKFLKGEIIGVDIQKVARPKNYKKVCKIDLNKQSLPFKRGYFDTIILGSCLEHVENPTKLLRESNKLLKNNGKLIVTVPHANYWWTTLHNWFFPFVKDTDEGEHLSNWTKIDMIRLLKVNGFMVIKIHGTNLTIPLTRIEIPVGHFPLLGWIIIFETVKIAKPKNYVLTRDHKTEEFIKVK